MALAKENYMQDKNIFCVFPNCKNKRASRGKRIHGEYARFAWCAHHRMGRGKKARLEFTLKKDDQKNLDHN